MEPVLEDSHPRCPFAVSGTAREPVPKDMWFGREGALKGRTLDAFGWQRVNEK